MEQNQKLRQSIAASFMTAIILSGCVTIDRGNFGPFQRSLNTRSHGYTVVADPTRVAPTKMVEVFEVQSGDCASEGGWNDCQNDRERSEMSEQNKTNYPGEEYWYGWSIYFPNDYRNVYPTQVTLGQFHQDKSHPVWMFQNGPGGYHLDDMVDGYVRKSYQLMEDSELRGRWHKIEIQVRWSKGEDGFFRVWANGKHKVDYRGRTLVSERVYFKYGLYRTFISRYKTRHNTATVPAQKVYFSNVRRAKSREALSTGL